MKKKVSKKAKGKVFIYFDKEFDIGADNVFISGVYKNVKQFLKLNEGMTPLCSYDANEVLKVTKSGLEKLK